MSLRDLALRLSSAKHAPLCVVAAGLLLTAPSLGGGISMDDHYLRAIVRGEAPVTRSSLDVYHFISDAPAEHAAVLDRGVFPWFTAPTMKAAFFRPLSSLSAVLDYAVLPDWPWLFHLESLALYGALIALVLGLYRAVLPTLPIALLAGLLFAIDDGHGIPVGWLANRNSLFAAVFGMSAVVLHHRATQHGFRAGFVLGPLALALGFASGEAVLGAFAYLVAHAIAYDESPLRRRLAALAPHALVLVAWALVSRSLGYGVRGSGYYVDPAHEPVRFLVTFPERALALLLAQFALPPADVWGMLPDGARLPFVLFGVAVLSLVGWVLVPILRRDRGARFLASGAAFALVPIAAGTPSDRNLLLVGVGAFGLVALVIGQTGPGRTRAATWLGRGFVVIHGVLAPLLLPVMSLAMGLAAGSSERGIAALGFGPDVARQTVVLVNSPMALVTGFYLATPRDGFRVPARLRALASSDSSVRIRREDERTVLLTPARGYASFVFDDVFRDPDQPLQVGETVVLPGTTFEVLEPGGAQPKSFRCRFDVPLEDPSLRWIAWDGEDGGRFLAFSPPRIGEEVVVGRH